MANSQIAALPGYNKVDYQDASAEKTLTDKLAQNPGATHIQQTMDEAINRYGT
jgi:hypothetical protein